MLNLQLICISTTNECAEAYETSYGRQGSIIADVQSGQLIFEAKIGRALDLKMTIPQADQTQYVFNLEAGETLEVEYTLRTVATLFPMKKKSTAFETLS